MKIRALSAFGLLALVASTAMAQETLTLPPTDDPAPLDSNGLLNQAVNRVVTITPRSSGLVNSIRLNGTLTAVNVGTWGMEANIRITLPNGSSVNMQPFPGIYTFSGGPLTATDFTVTLPAAVVPSSGPWTIRFYETYDDGGNASIDATWSDGLTLDLDLAPSDLAGTVAVNPARASVGSTALFTMAVVAGNPPLSTGIQAHIDLSQVGGSANQQMYDDGTNGDVTAGDNVYSYAFTVPNNATSALYALPWTLTDAQARSANGTVNFTPVAPPSNVVDLGTLDGAHAHLSAESRSYGANEVLWYKVNIPGGADANHFVDIHNRGSTAGAGVDVELGLYLSDGTLVASSDDWNGVGPSMVTFGQSSPTRLYNSPGSFVWTVAAAGQTGATLAPGEYYIAMGAFNVNYLTGWDVAATSTNTGTMELNLFTTTDQPTAPTGNGGSNSVTIGLPNAIALMHVATQIGLNPDSTDITVTANLTSLGGGAAVAMYDDGSHGDPIAGDGTFYLDFTVSNSTPAGTYAVPFTVRDAQLRSSTGSFNVSVSRVIDLGTLTSAGIVNTDGAIEANGIAWYKVVLPTCDDSIYVDMTTIGSSFSGSIDSEIGVYDSTGALMGNNDDFGGSLFSAVSFGGTTAASRNYPPFTTDCTGQTAGTLAGGSYYIAIGRYNVNFNADFDVTSTGGVAGSITLNLYANSEAGPAGCSLADITGIGGPPAIPDGLITGDDFVAFTNAFGNGDLLADVTGIGGPPAIPDGLLTGDDFVAFTNAFAAGCP